MLALKVLPRVHRDEDAAGRQRALQPNRPVVTGQRLAVYEANLGVGRHAGLRADLMTEVREELIQPRINRGGLGFVPLATRVAEKKVPRALGFARRKVVAHQAPLPAGWWTCSTPS